MSRVWFSQPLETVATWWRILRRDGVALGFTTHDADLWFDGLMHRATPGMVPSAIRRTADLMADSAEVAGAITHEAIAAADLAIGRFDGAGVVIGLVDWKTLERQPLYHGTIGTVSEEAGTFTAELLSRKAELRRDPVPRTSPSCRAEFCGRECGLAASRFTDEASVATCDLEANAVRLAGLAAGPELAGGRLRWFDGPLAGLSSEIVGVNDSALVLDMPLDGQVPAGVRVQIREGCDRTLATCATRFGNAVNFRGEPFLPGNDLLSRYGVGA
jgi:uncharacterized phage protein (TIGR02218 family)